MSPPVTPVSGQSAAGARVTWGRREVVTPSHRESTFRTSGVLAKAIHGSQSQRVDYVTRLLTRGDLTQLLILQDIVLANLPRPDIFEPYQPDWIRERIERQGYIIGVFVGQELAAFCHVYYPDVDDRECNYGFDLGLAAAERRHVVNLHMFCVHPRFRGNGIAVKLNRMALAEIEKGARQHYHVCSSVSPHNIYSLRVLFEARLQIEALALKYGGKLRYIVHRDLRRRNRERSI